MSVTPDHVRTVRESLPFELSDTFCGIDDAVFVSRKTHMEPDGRRHLPFGDNSHDIHARVITAFCLGERVYHMVLHADEDVEAAVADARAEIEAVPADRRQSRREQIRRLQLGDIAEQIAAQHRDATVHSITHALQSSREQKTWETTVDFAVTRVTPTAEEWPVIDQLVCDILHIEN